MSNTITKNRTAKIPTKSGKEYSYTYTDLASINKWLDENGLDYYQEIETNQANGKDYIMTYRYINGEWEDKPKRGCQVVDSILTGNSNPVQQYGSSLTYCRRYSLCLAFGLAMEDDDGASLNEMTKEQAEKYTIGFGKHKGELLLDLVKEEDPYIDWLLNNTKDENLLKAIELLTGRTQKTEEEWDGRLELDKKLQEIIVDKGLDVDKICEYYKVKRTTELSDEQIKEIIEKRG